MASIRQRDTTPEMAIRRALHAAGMRFRVNVRSLPGTPDVVLPSRRLALFVHGCFWHQHSCLRGKHPKTRPEYWQAKFDRNAARHKLAEKALRRLGWRVKVAWECNICSSEKLQVLVNRIAESPSRAKAANGAEARS